MRKVVLVGLVVLMVVGSIGCYGPQMLNRAVDDFANEGYQKSPWLFGNVVVYSLVGFAGWITWGIDGIINIYYFWVKDAQPFGSGKGTAYPHQRPIMPASK
jgi:hypothetical protein